jgi:hypothetical protein
MRCLTTVLLTLVAGVSPVLQAQSAEEQCQMIAALSSDFYSQRQNGKTLDGLKQDTPPEFTGTEFARTIDLALLLAFSLDGSLSEDQVNKQVYDSCMRNRP